VKTRHMFEKRGEEGNEVDWGGDAENENHITAGRQNVERPWALGQLGGYASR
jgi:hypothetical protein